jgi:hypothetical protein
MIAVLSWIIAIISVVGALAYWHSDAGQGVLLALLFLFAILGIFEAIAGWYIAARQETIGIIILSVALGTSLALLVVTIMSIAPVVVVVILLAGTILIESLRGTTQVISTSIIIVVVSYIVSFLFLFRLNTRHGVEFIKISRSARVLEAFTRIDYEDTFQVPIPSGRSLDIQSIIEGFIISMQPWFPRKPGRKKGMDVEIHPGGNIGGWEVFSKSGSEIIIGLNRKHIDLRLALRIVGEKHPEKVAATTVARFNNLFGRLYFIPVRYGHQIVLAETVRRLPIVLG